MMMVSILYNGGRNLIGNINNSSGFKQVTHERRVTGALNGSPNQFFGGGAASLVVA